MAERRAWLLDRNIFLVRFVGHTKSFCSLRKHNSAKIIAIITSLCHSFECPPTDARTSSRHRCGSTSPRRSRQRTSAFLTQYSRSSVDLSIKSANLLINTKTASFEAVPSRRPHRVEFTCRSPLGDRALALACPAT